MIELDLAGDRCEPRRAQAAGEPLQHMRRLPRLLDIARCQRCPARVARSRGRFRELKQHRRKLLAAEGVTQQIELAVLEQRFCFDNR